MGSKKEADEHQELAGQQAIDDVAEKADEVPGPGQFAVEAPRDENGVPVSEPVQDAKPEVQTEQ